MPTISTELVDKTREFLGEKGIRFFAEMLEKHGRVDAVFVEGKIPYAVHFNEGMQVRNFMRDTGLCDGWDAANLDDHWVDLITECLKKEV